MTISDAEYEAANKVGAKMMKRGPIVVFAAYDPASRTLLMTFADGTALTTPVDNVQGLADADDADLALIEIASLGSACIGRTSTPTCGCRTFVEGVTGTRAWIAARGGAAKSEAKAAAARRTAKAAARRRSRLEMQLGDFTIGREFLYGERRWRCTDIGTRVIVAIRLDQTEVCTLDDWGKTRGEGRRPDPSTRRKPPARAGSMARPMPSRRSSSTNTISKPASPPSPRGATSTDPCMR